MKKEKTVKSNEQKAKGYKIRGIIYAVIFVLLIASLIVFKHTPLYSTVYQHYLPKTMVQGVGADMKKITFYSEIVETEEKSDNGYFKVYYFVEDENGEQKKVYLSDGKYEAEDGSHALVTVGFNSVAAAKTKMVEAVIKALICAISAVIAIYLIRLSYFLYCRSEENKKILKEQFDEMNRKRKENNDE